MQRYKGYYIPTLIELEEMGQDLHSDNKIYIKDPNGKSVPINLTYNVARLRGDGYILAESIRMIDDFLDSPLL